MARGHEHYEELAVGHVLGGLDAAEAAEFRSHLLGCRHCRQRVAELRDIAAELAAAERDERRHVRVQTETERRTEPERRQAPPSAGLTTRHVTLAAVVVLLLAGALAFWNLQLRTTVDLYADVAEHRGDALRGLATGAALPSEVAEGLTAVVTVDGDHVAFTVAGIDGLDDADRVVAWLVNPGGARPGLVARGEQLDDGVFAGQIADRGAPELVITRESGPLAATPSGDELVRAALRTAATD